MILWTITCLTKKFLKIFCTFGKWLLGMLVSMTTSWRVDVSIFALELSIEMMEKLTHTGGFSRGFASTWSQNSVSCSTLERKPTNMQSWSFTHIWRQTRIAEDAAVKLKLIFKAIKIVESRSIWFSQHNSSSTSLVTHLIKHVNRFSASVRYCQELTRCSVGKRSKEDHSMRSSRMWQEPRYLHVLRRTNT